MNSFEDVVQCYLCKGKKPRRETLILQTPKGKFRLCRDCYTAYEEKRFKETLQEAKKNVKLFDIQSLDAMEIMRLKEDFLKKIKTRRI
jgi:hypothetical protein